MTRQILKSTALAMTIALSSTAGRAGEDREDPAIAGAVLTQEVLDLIHAMADPATREAAAAQLVDICPKLAVTG